MKRLILGAISLFMIVAMTGCSTSQHSIKLKDSYKPKHAMKVKVARIENQTSTTYKIPIKKMLRIAFDKQLAEANLLATNNAANVIVLNVDIVNFSEGNAFKRWVMPGWGQTQLTIVAKLYNKNHEIGTLSATRDVAMGGGFTIGAWKYIFNDLAKDVIDDLKKEFIR